MLDVNRTPVFVFIGTLKHHVDCIAPCVGKLVEKQLEQYKGIGEEKVPKFLIHYCDQQDMGQVNEELNKYSKEKYQIIALDVGFVDQNTKFRIIEGGIKPASLILEHDTKIGDIGIVINIKDVYSGSLKNQKKKFFKNLNNIKVQKKVDRIILDTFLNIEKLLRLYEGGKGE